MKTELKYGLIFSGTSLLWITLEFIVGLHTKYQDLHPILTNLFFIPAGWILWLAMKERKSQSGGKITFSAAFLCGLFISIIVAILSPVVALIFHKLINPHFFPDFIEYAVRNGETTEQEAEKYFNLKNYIIQGVFGFFIIGIIMSAVLAFFVVREKEES